MTERWILLNTKSPFYLDPVQIPGEKENQMMGDIVMPGESLEENFTSEYILQQLHSENWFDFDYAPSEGNNLQIRKEYIFKRIKDIPRPDFYDYMSFIYRHGKWEEEMYDVFSDKIRKFKMGIIERGLKLHKVVPLKTFKAPPIIAGILLQKDPRDIRP